MAKHIPLAAQGLKIPLCMAGFFGVMCYSLCNPFPGLEKRLWPVDRIPGLRYHSNRPMPGLLSKRQTRNANQPDHLYDRSELKRFVSALLPFRPLCHTFYIRLQKRI
jgi:hypothetical protein